MLLLLKISTSFREYEKCSDFHEYLPVSQFLRVKSISEVSFAKQSIPGKIPGNGFLEDFLEDLYRKTDANYLELFGNVILEAHIKK